MKSFLRKREIVRSLAGLSTTTRDGPEVGTFDFPAAFFAFGAAFFLAATFFSAASAVSAAISGVSVFFVVFLVVFFAIPSARKGFYEP